MSIFEKASFDGLATLRSATNFAELAVAFKAILGLADSESKKPVDLSKYKTGDSDYGLQVSGKKARERINALTEEILKTVDDPEDITDEQRDVLKQYSGRGGIGETFFEYYTPQYVAEGVWDAVKVNGLENGNVMDPSSGSGMFSATKGHGIVITGNDIDPTSSKIARLLNPGDHITTSSFEEIAANTPDDTFDGCVSNIPFGDARGQWQHKDPQYAGETRIDRYFIHRAIDKVRPGGLVCLIVPTCIVGTKGGEWKAFRTAISKKAEFLGAHKLPSKTFRSQGTDTVTDVIVFRKHPRELLDKIEDISTKTLKAANVIWDEFVSGGYWIGEGRKFIMGTYFPKVGEGRFAREVVDGDIDDAGLKAKLATKFQSRIDWTALEAAEPNPMPYAEGSQKVINGKMMTLTDGDWQAVESHDITRPISKDAFGADTLEELKSRLKHPRGALGLTFAQAQAVREAYPELLTQDVIDALAFAASQDPKYQEQMYRGGIIGALLMGLKNRLDDGQDVGSEQDGLRALVTAEVEKYGQPRNNKKLALAGKSSRAWGFFASALKEDGNFSDLLQGTLERHTIEASFESDDVSSIVTELYVRRGQTEIELEDILALYQGPIKINSLGDIAFISDIALTPDGFVEPMARFCSGDVYPKILAMQNASDHETDDRVKAKYQEQIASIQGKINSARSDEISFSYMQKWIDEKYIVEFLKEEGYSQVSFNGGRYFLNARGNDSFSNQFEKVLNGDKAVFRAEKGNEKSQNEKKEKVMRLRMMEDKFNMFMQQHDDIEMLTDQYNVLFNGNVPFEYESEDLGLDEYFSGQVKMHTYQNSEVRRLSELGSGVCGFGVGLGKSFMAFGLAAYNHKQGRAKRTCIVVPKSVIENMYHEARAIYAEKYMTGNVLVVGLSRQLDKDGGIVRNQVFNEDGTPRLGADKQPMYKDVVTVTTSKEKVYSDMWGIPQSNFSTVIMTKEQFQALPIREETVKSYMDTMVKKNLVRDTEAANYADAKGKKAEKKGYALAKKKARLEGEFSDTGNEKKSELPHLEDMGFDSIIMDEAHNYKNTFRPAQSAWGDKIRYLPGSGVSGIARDLSIKSHYLRSLTNGRGVYGLSATPVTNSPLEVFNILSLVVPIEEFEKLGINTPEDFIAMFAKTKEVRYQNISGEQKDGPGVVGFKNLDALRSLFYRYVNMKNVKDKDVGQEIHVPEKVEKPTFVELNDEQKELYRKLRVAASAMVKKERVENEDDILEKSTKSSVFSFIREMERVTTDMDLYHGTVTFVFKHKDRASVEGIVETLPKTYTSKVLDDEGEWEDVQQELSVEYHDDGGDTFTAIFPASYEPLVAGKFQGVGIDEREVSHPIPPKYAAMIANLKSHQEMNGKQLIFTDEMTQHGKIARIIANALEIDRSTIAIINAQEADGKEMDNIVKGYDKGEIRIVIANKKAEVGINLQRGTTAIHHLTLPWTPASLEQRNGRGVRQGNTSASVDIFYYFGKGSFDEIRKEILEGKSNWLDDIFNSTHSAFSNPDADSRGSDNSMLLAENIEDARRIAAENAQRAKDSEKRQNYVIAANNLKVLASQMAFLQNADALKEAEKTKLERQLADAVYLSENGYDDEAKGKAKKEATHLKGQITRLDAAYEDRKQKAEKLAKQKRGYLKHMQKEGNTPFGLDVIENPTSTAISPSGDVYVVGGLYEFTESTWDQTFVFRVTEAHAEKKSIQVEMVSGGYYSFERSMGLVDLGKLPKGIHQVSYSDDELALNKAFESGISKGYTGLIESRISRDAFFENREKIKVTGSYFVAADEEISLVEVYSDTAPANLVWPDPQDENLKGRIFKAYFIAGKPTNYNAPLSRLYGPDYLSLAADYGTKATDEQFLEACNHAWNDAKVKAATQNAMDEMQALTSATWAMRGFVQGIGDNTKDADRVFNQFFATLKNQITERYNAEVADAKRLADEAINSNPKVQALTPEIVEDFNTFGIKIKINTTEFISAYKGRRYKYAAFERYFLQDSAGKGGPVHRSKEEYSMKFTSDFEVPGAWWHVDSGVDLAKLLQTIKDKQ